MNFKNLKILNFKNFYKQKVIQQNVHIMITKIFLQIGKIPNNNEVTAIWKLSKLKGHPVGPDNMRYRALQGQVINSSTARLTSNLNNIF